MSKGLSSADLPEEMEATGPKPLSPDELIAEMRVGAAGGGEKALEGVFLLGALDRPVTIRSQQVRALNLVHALERKEMLRPKATILVVGGGIAGMTFAVGAAFRGANVHLVERRSELLHLQRGNETRWVHPHIVDWPARWSEQDDAGLPLMNWKAGRAGAIVDGWLDEWFEMKRRLYPRLHEFVNVSDLKCDLGARTARWGNREQERYGLLVLAIGFGIERTPAAFRRRCYWRNDDLGQAEFSRNTAERTRYFVTGSGDGGLVDLLRIRIRDFRQEDILRLLFGRRSEARVGEAGRDRLKLKSLDRDEEESLKQELLRIDREAVQMETQARDRGEHRGAKSGRYLTSALRNLVIPDAVLSNLGELLRKDTEAWLNSRTEDWASLDTSMVNRFLTATLLRADSRCTHLVWGYAPTPIPGDPDNRYVCRREDGDSLCWPNGGEPLAFHEVVVRHGTDQDALFAPFEHWISKQMRHEWEGRLHSNDNRLRAWPRSYFSRIPWVLGRVAAEARLSRIIGGGLRAKDALFPRVLRVLSGKSGGDVRLVESAPAEGRSTFLEALCFDGVGDPTPSSQTVVLRGASGAGKSLLALSAVAKLPPASCGALLVDWAAQTPIDLDKQREECCRDLAALLIDLCRSPSEPKRVLIVLDGLDLFCVERARREGDKGVQAFLRKMFEQLSRIVDDNRGARSISVLVTLDDEGAELGKRATWVLTALNENFSKGKREATVAYLETLDPQSTVVGDVLGGFAQSEECDYRGLAIFIDAARHLERKDLSNVKKWELLLRAHEEKAAFSGSDVGAIHFYVDSARQVAEMNAALSSFCGDQASIARQNACVEAFKGDRYFEWLDVQSDRKNDASFVTNLGTLHDFLAGRKGQRFWNTDALSNVVSLLTRLGQYRRSYDYWNVNLDGAYFGEADLSGHRFMGVSLRNAIFRKATLTSTAETPARAQFVAVDIDGAKWGEQYDENLIQHSRPAESGTSRRKRS